MIINLMKIKSFNKVLELKHFLFVWKGSDSLTLLVDGVAASSSANLLVMPLASSLAACRTIVHWVGRYISDSKQWHEGDCQRTNAEHISPLKMATRGQTEPAECPLTPRQGRARGRWQSGERLRLFDDLEICRVWKVTRYYHFETWGKLPTEVAVPNCEQIAVLEKVRHLERNKVNISMRAEEGGFNTNTSFSRTLSLSLVALVLDRAVM